MKRRVLSLLILSSALVGTASADPAVLAGWDAWENAGSASTPTELPDGKTPEIIAEITYSNPGAPSYDNTGNEVGGWVKNSAGDASGNYGATGGSIFGPGTGCLQTKTDEAHLDIYLENQSDRDISVETLHVDIHPKSGPLSGYRVEVTSGDMTISNATSGTLSATGANPSGSENYSNQLDIDLTYLEDHMLSAGESVTLTFFADGTSGGGNPYYLDNLAISGDVPPAPIEPVIQVKGDNYPIGNGDTETSTANLTDFGVDSLLTESGKTNTFVIENVGLADLLLTGTPIVTLSGDTSEFTVVEQPTNSIIAVGGTNTFTIVYKGLVEDTTNTAVVSILNNDADYTFTISGISPALLSDISVSGVNNGGAITNGQPVGAVFEDDYRDGTEFGYVHVGEPVTTTFRVQNTGYTNLMVSGVGIAGSPQFSVIAAPMNIEVGTNELFYVVFDPQLATTGVVQSATITVTNDAPGKEIYSFDIQGTGIEGAGAEILAAWTDVGLSNDIPAFVLNPHVSAATSLDYGGGSSLWKKTYTSSRDYSYGFTGGRQLYPVDAVFADGAGNQNVGINYVRNDAATLSLRLTVSNISDTASIDLTSFHFDAEKRNVDCPDVAVALEGDITSAAVTNAITLLSESKGDFQDFDIPLSGTLLPHQSVDVVLSIDGSTGNGGGVVARVYLDNFAIRGTISGGAMVTPNIMSFALSGGSGTLIWESEDGITYNILGRSALTDPWGTNTSGIASGGSSTTGTVSAAASAGYFMIEAE